MQIKSFLTTVLLSATTLSFVGAQTAQNKHLLGGFAVFNDFAAPLNNQYFNFDQKAFTGLEFWYGYRLNSSLNLEATAGFGSMKYPTVILDKNIKRVQDATYGSVAPRLAYKFNNGYLLKESSPVAPYIFGGIGALGGVPQSSRNGLDVFAPFGAGIKFGSPDVTYITIEGEYRKSLLEMKDNFVLKVGACFAGGPAKDTDKDGISDENDKCPDVAGLKQFDGCPDTDGDGLIDSQDDCPKDKGLATLKGCPDADGDGIADKDDLCPSEKGSADMKGCPDADGDGIADKDDLCPSEKGSADMKGCPDTDGDGIADKDDKCPKVAGVAALKGCPDADGDGIGDKDDLCPNDKGLEAFNGCPDTDGDGIADKDDKCPKVAGPARTEGCPETVQQPQPVKERDGDNDGIVDSQDKCPNEAGVKENFGCPIKKEVTFSFSSILFETGKSVLKSESYATLDQVVTILTQNPNHTANIQGHTDSQGKPDANQKLSEARAKACLDYLASKGIAASRLSSVGMGDKVPVADNKTADGRAANRRVEFKLSLPK